MIFIDKNNYLEYILKFITEGKIKKLLDTMDYDTGEFESGFVTGLAWASLLTSQIPTWEIEMSEGDLKNNEDTAN